MKQALDVFFSSSWGFFVTIGLGIALVIVMQLLGWPARAKARSATICRWHSSAL